MEKQEQTEVLSITIDGINFLRTLNFRNSEFAAWLSRVTQLLEKLYGEDSLEYKRFINAPGRAFIVRTEKGLSDEYLRKLDCYESALRSLIEENEGRND